MNDSFTALDLPAAATAPRPSRPALRRPRSWRRPVAALQRTRALVLMVGGLAGLAGAMSPTLAAGAPAPAPGVPVVGARPEGQAKGPQAAPLPTIALEEVKIGQRGYGLSVFAGG